MWGARSWAGAPTIGTIAPRGSHDDWDHMTIEYKQPDELEKDPEPKRPRETIEDLAPHDKEGEAVMGGVSLSYEQIQWEYTKQKN